MKAIWNYIRKDEWSPYIAGILLGIVGILTVVFGKTLLGASGGFENIAGMIGKVVAPAAFDNMYFNFVMPAEVLALLPKIAALDPAGRKHLQILLENPEAAGQLLQRLSRLDPDLIRRVKTLDREAQALLIALAGG